MQMMQKPRMRWRSALLLSPFIRRNWYCWETPTKSEFLSSISQEEHTWPWTPAYVWVGVNVYTWIGMCVDACVHKHVCMCLYRHTAQSSSPVLATEHVLFASSKSSQSSSVPGLTFHTRDLSVLFRCPERNPCLILRSRIACFSQTTDLFLSCKCCELSCLPRLPFCICYLKAWGQRCGFPMASV